MLQLLYSAGLWTLAALALPLAIHLWRPPPQTVRLGSLRFLENLPHLRLRNLRWRERILLAVRLALLAALALLVAGLRWQPRPSARPGRWILLDPSAAPAGASAERLRRLQAEGWTVHLLAPGLPLQGSDTAKTSTPDLWSLLREADAALPEGSSLAVFTPGRTAALRGERPALRHCRVEWIATPDAAAGETRSWIESAGRFVPAGQAASVRALAGTTSAASTRFDAVPGPPGGPAVEFSLDKTRVRVGNDGWSPVPPAPGALRVCIVYDAGHAEDARYLAAAVRAAAEVAGRPLALTVQPDGSGNPPAADWLFWLSDRPAPDTAPNTVTDAGAVPRDLPASSEGWIVPLPGTPGAAALSGSPVRLWRRTPVALNPKSDEILWTDAQGEPLLTLVCVGLQKHWTFHGRFHPDWTNLPRTSALAAWTRDLLFPLPAAAPSDPAHDLRLADPSQYSQALSPSPSVSREPAPIAAPDATDLHWPLWCLAALLFAAERLLSRPRAPGAVLAPPIPVPAAVR